MIETNTTPNINSFKTTLHSKTINSSDIINNEYVASIEHEEVLIYDIETETIDKKPNAKKDIMKFFGFYSYKIGKSGIIPFTDKAAIQKLINNHQFLVGFNNRDYDNPIIERSGLNLEFKRIVDLSNIIKSRAGSMITKKGMLKDKLMKYSLDYITKFLDLVDDDSSKMTLDYDILKKNHWTRDEAILIRDYTIRDIDITKKLYEWLNNYFESFKDFLPEHDVKKKYHLTDGMPKFGYKAICYAMGWEPVFNRNFVPLDEEEHEKLTGGYVAFPAGEKFFAKLVKHEKDGISFDEFQDIIVQLDFSSLYPHIMMMANLYGRNKNNEPGWAGTDLINVKGIYNNKELGGVGLLLRKWYYLRLFYKRKSILEDGTIIKFKDAKQYIGKNYYHISEKKGRFELETLLLTDSVADYFLKMHNEGADPREYTIKILLNLVYGLLNQPYYSLVYDEVGGADCTRIGRQFVKYARHVFREAGYPMVYSDSVSKDSLVTLNNGIKISVEDYWDKYIYDIDIDTKEYAKCTEPILTCNDNFENILCLPKTIIRHKTKKLMYKITLTNEQSINVTEDHSLITINPKTQQFESVKPNQLKDIKYVLKNKNAVVNRVELINFKLNKQSDFVFVKIKNIETYYTDDYVYDFSINKYEKFYANDILVHNTDSWYFIDIYNNKSKYIALKNKVITDIKASMNFPQVTFDADIDAEIKYLFFFKGKVEDKPSDKEMDVDDYINKPKGFMKKNYIYVTTDNDLIIKNLGIKKKSISALSKKIFWDYLVPQIKSNGKIKYDYVEIQNLMYKLLREDITLAYMRKNVNNIETYGKFPNGIYAQIARLYGPGIHFLIPNIRNIGIGKTTKYCSIEDFEKYKMDIGDIDFKNFWKELNYFIKTRVQPNLFQMVGMES